MKSLPAINSAEYKLLKEQSVSGHSGTTLTHLYVLALTPAAFFMNRFLLTELDFLQLNSLWIDYGTIVIPLIFSFTIFANHTTEILLMSYIISALLIVFRRSFHQSQVIHQSYNPQIHFPFISLYRVSMTLSTCIAILAVDFPAIFPLDKFAKTESLGVSLMDLGVGGYIFSMGLTSRQAMNKQKITTKQLFFHLMPLILIGTARLWTVNKLNYQLHTTEYGVHWNFFITLAVLTFLGAFLHLLFKSKVIAILGLILACLYQFCLLRFGLTEYLLSNTIDRTQSLLVANKEGIYSCVGYVTIYCIAVQIGYWIKLLNTSQIDERKKVDVDKMSIFLSSATVKSVALLFGITVLFTLLSIAVSTFIQSPSRRLVNLSYVLLTVAYNTLVILSFQIVCSVCVPPLQSSDSSIQTSISNKIKQEPIRQNVFDGVISLINANQLLTFLVANLLTGIINLSIRTLFCNIFESLTILLSYTVVFIGIISFIDHLKNRLRKNNQRRAKVI